MSTSSTFSSSLLHLVLLLILSLAVLCSISEARPVAAVLEKPAAPAGKSQIFSKKGEENPSVHARVSAAKASNETEPKPPVGKIMEHDLKVDRRNHGADADERQPGSFNQLDYDPPRTHPPSHN